MKRAYMIKMMIPKPLTFENILLKLLYMSDYVLSYLLTQKIFIGILSVLILTKMPLAISM